MKTKPQRTEATCFLLRAADKLLLKPYKWLIWRCGRNLLLISLSLYKGSVSERKMEGGNTKKFSALTSHTWRCGVFMDEPEPDARTFQAASPLGCAAKKNILKSCCTTRFKRSGEKMPQSKSPPQTLAFHLCFSSDVAAVFVWELRSERTFVFSLFHTYYTCDCFLPAVK